MKRLLFILTMVIGLSTYAQDPQTNAPSVLYPLLDEYIKEGFDRNHRFHTRILRRIDYMYLISITRIYDTELFTNEWGTSDTFMLYRWYDTALAEWRFVMSFNEAWYNNYYVLRRMFFKSIGWMYGYGECHKDCKHIMSGRQLMDPVLVFYDAVPELWEKELDVFYDHIKNSKL